MVQPTTVSMVRPAAVQPRTRRDCSTESSTTTCSEASSTCRAVITASTAAATASATATTPHYNPGPAVQVRRTSAGRSAFSGLSALASTSDRNARACACLLYTSDAADEEDSVDL